MEKLKPKDMDDVCDWYWHSNTWDPLKFINITGDTKIVIVLKINALRIYSECFYFLNHH